MNRQSERLVKHYAKVIDKLTREGRKGLLSDLEAIDWSDVTEGANQAVDAMMRHCGRYSRGNAAMAAAYYDRLRKNEVGKVLGAVAECDYDPDELEDDVRGMVEGIREGKPRETFESKCADRFEYEARNAAKDCVGKNVARDPLKPRYAVVPGGTCCTFCAMLASRGPVYHDASSCEGLHAHCGCAAVPTWERDREGNYRLDYPGYDPDYYRDRWEHPDKYNDDSAQDASVQTTGRQIIENVRDGFSVAYIEPAKWERTPSTSEIVDAVGGGDKTDGSCSSLAFAYFANKGGDRVLDFRGGSSQAFFATPRHIKEICGIDGVSASIETSKDAFKAARKALESVQEGKRYYFCAGSHAAVIEKRTNGVYYLELQTESNNGWRELTESELKCRFACKKSRTSHGVKLDQTALVIDGDSLASNAEFKELMGYVNTQAAGQQKGAGGHAK